MARRGRHRPICRGDSAAVDASLNGSPAPLPGSRCGDCLGTRGGLAPEGDGRAARPVEPMAPDSRALSRTLGRLVDIGAVSLRRWFRLVGHVVMAAVLVSEPSPIEAVRSVLRRCA